MQARTVGLDIMRTTWLRQGFIEPLGMGCSKGGGATWQLAHVMLLSIMEAERSTDIPLQVRLAPAAGMG